MKISGSLTLLHAWAKASERYWYRCLHNPALGCYGTGYNSWGVQTNQKYLAAMATLAVHPDSPAGADRDWALARAQAALRFSLASHVSGDGRCTDGTQWGHTWISSLGIERMMHGVYQMESLLVDKDRADLKRVLISEADWLMKCHGIRAAPWNKDGNVPESNLWNGALLWRVSVMYPDQSSAADWQDYAHRFLINAVSIPSDAQDDSVVAGQPVRARHVGANFFPHYALDHHGYLNVGYMVICASNAAMLHFDLQSHHWPVPASLYHHQADLWRVLRRFIFSNGRLVRIGGDTRVRYAYCQDYLLPALLYAADHLGDAAALDLFAKQMEFIQQEADYNGDGSFYGRRLTPLAESSPYYYTRLESDRACALSQGCVFAGSLADAEPPAQDFEASVAGSWGEPEHGAALHRSPKRLASFAWRAHGWGQGMCQPPANGHLVDWESNLCGRVEFVTHPVLPAPAGARAGRRLINSRMDSFDGGFLASGALCEGVDIEFCEGWRSSDLAVHQLVFAALPDDRTVVGLQRCRMMDKRGYVFRAMGLHLNLVNDMFNGFSRTLHTRHGQTVLSSPSQQTECLALDSSWVNIDNQLGVVGLYGADEMRVGRSVRRRASTNQSLYVEEVGWGGREGPRWMEPRAVIFDVGWMVLSSADARLTATAAGDCRSSQRVGEDSELRAVSVQGADGRCYSVIANFGSEARGIPGTLVTEPVMDLVSGKRFDAHQAPAMILEPGAARVLVAP